MFLRKDTNHILLTPNSMFLIYWNTVLVNPPSILSVLGYQKIVKCSHWVDAIIDFFHPNVEMSSSKCRIWNQFGKRLEWPCICLFCNLFLFNFISKRFWWILLKIMVQSSKLWCHHPNYGAIIQIIAQSSTFWHNLGQLSWE